mmetsp:Transcript_16338/g.35809  ORF Transcript_16338/g.35809 Transcript_16338/m.35809 type:complete len:216 (+) Transcript_16338:656-1303(+)
MDLFMSWNNNKRIKNHWNPWRQNCKPIRDPSSAWMLPLPLRLTTTRFGWPRDPWIIRFRCINSSPSSTTTTMRRRIVVTTTTTTRRTPRLSAAPPPRMRPALRASAFGPDRFRRKVRMMMVRNGSWPAVIGMEASFCGVTVCPTIITTMRMAAAKRGAPNPPPRDRPQPPQQPRPNLCRPPFPCRLTRPKSRVCVGAITKRGVPQRCRPCHFPNN